MMRRLPVVYVATIIVSIVVLVTLPVWYVTSNSLTSELFTFDM